MKRYCPVCHQKHCHCDLKGDADIDSQWLFTALAIFGLFAWLVYYFR